MKNLVFADGKTIYLEQVMEFLAKCHPKLRAPERYLILELIRRKKFGQSFASFEQIGESIGCSKNGAENIAKKLRGAGLLMWKSGSVKGCRRLSNEYSLDKLLCELNAFHQARPARGKELNHPNNLEGHPDVCEGSHPNNYARAQGTLPEKCIGPSKILGTQNNIERNISKKATKEVGREVAEMSAKFYDFWSLNEWVKIQPALKGVPKKCLYSFYLAMKESGWSDRRGQQIENLVEYILAWSRRYDPNKYSDVEIPETPGDSLRREDDLRRRMIEKFGIGTSE